MIPNPTIGVFTRERRETFGHTEKGHVKTEAEAEAMLTQNKDRSHQKLESQGRILPQNL